MPKNTKSIEWWKTKSAAYGETVMLLAIGTLFSYLKVSIGIPVTISLFCIGCLIIWRAYSKTSVVIPIVLIIVCAGSLSIWQAYFKEPIANSNFAAPDALISPTLRNMDIRISDLTRESFIIRNKTFYNCRLYGPAVIYPKKGLMISNTFADADVNSGFIETTNKTISGTIALDNCVIQNCTFHKISLIGSPEQIKKWKEGIEK